MAAAAAVRIEIDEALPGGQGIAPGGEPAGARDEHVRVEGDDDIDIVGTALPLIPPGPYEAYGGPAKRRRVFRTAKLAVSWTILIPGTEAPERVTLSRFYNVHDAPGRRLKVGASSDYQREWIMVARRRPSRRDRLSPRVFHGAVCLVEVATVERDSHQRLLPEHARYSVVRRLIEHRACGGRA